MPLSDVKNIWEGLKNSENRFNRKQRNIIHCLYRKFM